MLPSTPMATGKTTHSPAVRRPWHAVPLALRHPLRFVWQLTLRANEDGILTIAAAMAYYFFFSLFPLVLFLIALVSLAPVEGLMDWLLARAALFVPGDAHALIEATIRGFLGQPRSGLVSLGAILALWTASSAFASVMDGLNRAYRVPEYRSWWRVRLQAMGLTVALSIFLILTFVLTIFGGQLAALIGRLVGPRAEFVALFVSWTVVVGAVTVVVASIDYACPATPPRWRWLTPGSLVFMLGFAAVSAAFSYYVQRFAAYDATYGSLGAVIVLLVWMYLLAVFLLLGGEVNALLEHMSRVKEAEETARSREGAGELSANAESETPIGGTGTR
jgi:membrane protein